MSVNHRCLALIALLAAAAILSPGLGNRTLWVPDEGRYAEIGREMLVTGDLVTPRLNGARYFEKPPLMYWLTAGSLAAFGRDEWVARLPVLLMALLGAAATFFLARSMAGPVAGVIAVVVLAANPLYFALSRFLVLDMALQAFITVGMWLVWYALDRGPADRRLLGADSFVWASVAFGLATLTKGPVGIVLPLMILAPLVVFERVREAIRTAPWIRMVVAYLAVTAPWFVLVSLRQPEFAWFFFVNEHFNRFLKTAHQRPGPIWYFLPIVALGFFPWSGLLPASLRRPVLRGLPIAFLLSWVLVPFAFFSMSKSKLPPYILPIWPALAVFVASSAAEPDPDRRRWSPGLACAGCAVIALIPAALVPFVSRLPGTAYPDLVEIRPYIVTGLVLSSIGALVAAALFASGSCRVGLALLAVGSVAGLHLAERVAKRYEVEKDVSHLAALVRQRAAPSDRVVVYGTLEIASGLPYYLDRTVVVGGHHFGELTFAHDSMKSDEKHLFADAATAQAWMAPDAPRAFFVTTWRVFEDYFARLPQLRLTEIARRGDLILFTNR